MKVRLFSLSAIAALASVNPASSVDASPTRTAAQAMASVNYLIGTWACAHTVGTFSGRYTTTYSRVLDNRWLRQTWDFPAQNAGQDEQAAVKAETFIGFDEGRQAWVRFFANSLGQHFEIRMMDLPNGWSFKYVSFFPRKKAETPDPDAIFIHKSDTEYTVDGPTYPLNGTPVTEHHSCHKL